VYADDSPRLTAAWTRLLERCEQVRLVAVAHEAKEMMTLVHDHRPDVVMCDLLMPGADPLECIAEMVRAGLPTRALVYSGLSGMEIVDRAYACGAWGVIGKHMPPEQVIDCIQKVARGETVFPKD